MMTNINIDKSCPVYLLGFINGIIEQITKDVARINKTDVSSNYQDTYTCTLSSVDKDGCLNQSNKGKRKDCTSGFIGVNYNIDKQKWTARLQFYGKRKDICYKDTAYECALAREKYIIENNLPHTRNFND